MNKLKFTKKETDVLDKKKGFIASTLTALRHKINDPLGKKRAK
jgi:hypothetical protein